MTGLKSVYHVLTSAHPSTSLLLISYLFFVIVIVVLRSKPHKLAKINHYLSSLSKQQITILFVSLTIGLVFLFSAIAVLTRPKNQITEVAETEPRIGVEINQTAPNPLPLRYDLDQNRYAQAIEQSWSVAHQAMPGRILNFENDPQLMSYIYRTETNECQSLMFYANLPIIIETEWVESLNSGNSYEIDLDSRDYQLLIHFRYSPNIDELDVPQILSEVFTTIAGDKSGVGKGDPNFRAKAIEELTNPISN